MSSARYGRCVVSRAVAPFAVAVVAATAAALLAIGCGSDDGALGADVGDPGSGAPGDGPGSGGAGGGGTSVDAGTIDAAPPIPANGLRGDYFDDFSTEKLLRYDPNVAFDFGTTAPGAGLRGESYSIRWSGTITPAYSETYTFVVHSDDGARLWIDGKLVVDDWVMHSQHDAQGTAALTASKPVALRLEFYQYQGAASAQLSWSSTSQAKEVVPTTALVPAATAPADTNGKPLGAPRPDFKNAVVPFDCPDPGILRVDGAAGALPTYYMTCTGGSFPIRSSGDLVTWKDTGASILPSGAAPWAADGFRNWAPEIHQIGNQFVAYFTASGAGGRLSIGTAHASSPTGPWTADAQPLVRDASLGAIDATEFSDDDGKLYLYWKLDGNAVGQPTPIFVQQLRADGLGFAPGSSRTQVLVNDPGTWEGGVVEAPWVIKRNGMYYLFYSGNVYDERYATGVARASSPTGPFAKHGAPILQNDASWVGPGHGSVVVAHGADFFFHHAWPTNGAGVRNGNAGRWGLVDRIVWANGWPTFAGNVSAAALQAWP